MSLLNLFSSSTLSERISQLHNFFLYSIFFFGFLNPALSFLVITWKRITNSQLMEMIGQDFVVRPTFIPGSNDDWVLI